MRIGRGNRRTWRKPAPVPLCPPQIPHYLTRARSLCGKPATNRLSYGTAFLLYLLVDPEDRCDIESEYYRHCNSDIIVACLNVLMCRMYIAVTLYNSTITYYCQLTEFFGMHNIIQHNKRDITAIYRDILICIK
jgi:hypothetical protein